jgi:hypothetical protein
MIVKKEMFFQDIIDKAKEEAARRLDSDHLGLLNLQERSKHTQHALLPHPSADARIPCRHQDGAVGRFFPITKIHGQSWDANMDSVPVCIFHAS